MLLHLCLINPTVKTNIVRGFTALLHFPTLVNNIDNLRLTEEKKALEGEEEVASGPRQILPYSSMFIFGQTNP